MFTGWWCQWYSSDQVSELICQRRVWQGDEQVRSCRKCGDSILGRQANARYCGIDCQEQRRNPDYVKPVPRVRVKPRFYNPAFLGER